MKQIGSYLVDAALITHEQLQRGLAVSEKQKIRLGAALIDMGFITEDDLQTALSSQFGIPRIDADELVVDPTVLHEIPAQLARQLNVIPLHIKSGALVVATSDPLNISILADLESKIKRRIVLVIASTHQIKHAISRYYAGRERLDESINQVQLIENETSIDELEAADAQIQSAPIVKFVNQILQGAVREHASDIHVERDNLEFHIRYRIDGMLKTMFRPKQHLHQLIVSRIKVMARLDVSEHRIPQDGRIMMTMDNQPVDFRVAICPCIDGENAVIRVLNRDNQAMDLTHLGFSPAGLEKLESLISRNFGLVLIAGQTGSGKTTTLYAILQKLNEERKKIITLEDPVEKRLPLLNQIQINPKVDLTFATGLRSILRMDPDIILIGEIRDGETANLAVNAAMTGHLVFSTIHCGIAAEVPVRLAEIGVEPYLAANVLLGTIAQRLVRLNCPNCLVEEELSEQIRKRFDPDFQSYRGKGCAACAGIGYRGRGCIEEVMPVTDEIRKLMLARATTRQLEEQAVKNGMVPLLESGISKIRHKQTSFMELARVL